MSLREAFRFKPEQPPTCPLGKVFPGVSNNYFQHFIKESKDSGNYVCLFYYLLYFSFYL